MRFPLQQITNPNKNNCTCKQKNTTNEKKKKKRTKKVYSSGPSTYIQQQIALFGGHA